MLGIFWDPPDIGTHLNRKGAASYAAGLHFSGAGGRNVLLFTLSLVGGTTASPPQTAISIRLDHSLGGVKGIYIKYEAAADQYLGRVVAGLPVCLPEFGVLPPHFLDENAEVVKEVISACFPRSAQLPKMVPI